MKRFSTAGLLNGLHCLTRNLTLRSSRNTPSGIIVAFSTIPPLHQFLLAEKTGSPYNAFPVEGSVPDPEAGLETLYREQERRKRVLGWRRTHKDPFEGEWEQILSWLQDNPERSSGDIFRELQCCSPGRYQPLQIRTLQRGMRKIRAYLLETQQEQWQDEVIRGPLP